MRNHSTLTSVVALFTAALLTTSVNAQLLDGVVGDGDSGAAVTIDSGEAGDSGAVNLGLGGGDGNVVDANVLPGGGGGDNNAVDANVSIGGSEGALDVDASVGGGAVDANVNVGGDGGGANVDVGIGGGGGSTGGGGDGGGSTDGGGNVGGGTGGGGGDGTGGGGGNGGGGTGGGGGNGTGGGNGGGSASLGTGVNACAGVDPNQAVSLFEASALGNWARASNIEIVPIQLCPEARQQVANYLRSSGKYGALQNAVLSDQLISAALSRSSYDPSRVLGVDQNGSSLTVYVF
jgi:hypothetical protein